jgi:integrase
MFPFSGTSYLDCSMSININITKRERTRRLKSGAVVKHTRYVLNFRDPRTRDRKQLFFERLKDAQRKAAEISAAVTTGTYAPERNVPTIADAVQSWLKDREGNVKERTHWGYQNVARYITDPLLIGTTKQRSEYTMTGETPQGTRLEQMLGNVKVSELTTADIRSWHKLLTREVGSFTANRAKLYLSAALTLVAEDHMVRPPPMPSNLGRGRKKEKKAILTPEQALSSSLRPGRIRNGAFITPFRFLSAHARANSSPFFGKTSTSTSM